ncbi:hypothetical protein EHQ24_10770 [Leptospira noumeaensis]|uniref:Uncharacterized protein n=1 Tax=Leptospira noumeaensis TaxID=2484964 RepID=A0A4R9I6Q7_9LEPT|nr:hypothetical protein [Leptospira noumeaensis]TGK81772.1 hypothetical protein EHQ24_10770 [Leptospira noumeaensis]
MRNLLLIFSLLSFSFCSQEDWREQMEAKNQKVILQVEQDHKQFDSYRLNPKDWSVSSKTKELAIENFLKEISKTKKAETFYVSWEEKLTVIFPNTKGSGTLLDTTPLVEYRKVLERREEFALIELSNLLAEKTFIIESIDWEKPRLYGNLKGYKPRNLKLKIAGKSVTIQQIKMVFQTNSGYKVGVLSP